MATLSGEWPIKIRKMEFMAQHQVALHASPNPGPDPVRPEDIPIAPSSPYEKGKSPHKFQASTQIKPNNIMVPFVPKDAETDEAYGEGNVPGHPDWSGVNQGTDVAGGPDYIGDKKTYGKLDRILNPLGDFKKPTLDQLKIHAANYPKA